jgi:uncharacterized cupredoxin-like copper-binding protein
MSAFRFRSRSDGRSRTLVITALTVLAIGCGTKNDDASQTADSSATSTAATRSGGTPNTVTVTAKDFVFDGPSEIPAGWTTVRLVNQGKEIHHVQVMRFDSGKTLADFVAAMRAMKPTDPMPSWAHDVGGPNAPAPGSEFSATINLEPGDYGFLCFVPTPDNVPHVMKGMMKAFTVTPATSAASAEPSSNMTMTLSDYEFKTSTPLTAGTHTIRIENMASQSHEVEIVRLDPGKTVDDFLAWAKDFKGAPPAMPVGGISGIGKGQHGFFTVTLTPGDYGLICFLPDSKDGKPHFMHGMKKQFKIS